MKTSKFKILLTFVGGLVFVGSVEATTLPSSIPATVVLMVGNGTVHTCLENTTGHTIKTKSGNIAPHALGNCGPGVAVNNTMIENPTAIAANGSSVYLADNGRLLLCTLNGLVLPSCINQNISTNGVSFMRIYNYNNKPSLVIANQTTISAYSLNSDGSVSSSAPVVATPDVGTLVAFAYSSNGGGTLYYANNNYQLFSQQKGQKTPTEISFTNSYNGLNNWQINNMITDNNGYIYFLATHAGQTGVSNSGSQTIFSATINSNGTLSALKQAVNGGVFSSGALLGLAVTSNGDGNSLGDLFVSNNQANTYGTFSLPILSGGMLTAPIQTAQLPGENNTISDIAAVNVSVPTSSISGFAATNSYLYATNGSSLLSWVLNNQTNKLQSFGVSEAMQITNFLNIQSTGEVAVNQSFSAMNTTVVSITDPKGQQIISSKDISLINGNLYGLQVSASGSDMPIQPYHMVNGPINSNNSKEQFTYVSGVNPANNSKNQILVYTSTPTIGAYKLQLQYSIPTGNYPVGIMIYDKATNSLDFQSSSNGTSIAISCPVSSLNSGNMSGCAELSYTNALGANVQSLMSNGEQLNSMTCSSQCSGKSGAYYAVSGTSDSSSGNIYYISDLASPSPVALLNNPTPFSLLSVAQLSPFNQ